MKKKYFCPCGFEFVKEVEYHQNFNAEGKMEKKGMYSTQVQCPNCANLIPTWSIEYLNNPAGRKHIHIRR